MSWKRLASLDIAENVDKTKINKPKVLASLDVEDTLDTIDITKISHDSIFPTISKSKVVVVPHNVVNVDRIVHKRAEIDVHRTVECHKVVFKKQKSIIDKSEYLMKLNRKLPMTSNDKNFQIPMKLVQFLEKEAFEGIIS